MKTFKQLINEVTRVRQSEEAWKKGVESTNSVMTPHTDNLGDKNFRGGREQAFKVGNVAATNVTRRKRVELTKGHAERIANNIARAKEESARRRKADAPYDSGYLYNRYPESERIADRRREEERNAPPRKFIFTSDSANARNAGK